MWTFSRIKAEAVCVRQRLRRGQHCKTGTRPAQRARHVPAAATTPRKRFEVQHIFTATDGPNNNSHKEHITCFTRHFVTKRHARGVYHTRLICEATAFLCKWAHSGIRIPVCETVRVTYRLFTDSFFFSQTCIGVLDRMVCDAAEP